MERNRINDQFLAKFLGYRASRYRRRKINPLRVKFYAYRRTGLAVPSVLGRLRIIPLALARASRAGVGLQSLDMDTKVFHRDFSIDSLPISTLWQIWITDTNESDRSEEKRADEEQRANRWTSPFLATTSSE